MNWRWSSRGRQLLAPVLLGLIWGAAFPRWDFAGLAWVVPGGLMLLAVAFFPEAPFRAGYLAGMVHFLFSLSWLLRIPFPAGAIAGWAALSGYLALYPAVWVWCCGFLLRGRALGQGVGWAGRAEGSAASDGLAGGAWLSRVCLGLVLAASWVAWEMAVSRLLSGFPWNLLGVSQYRVVPLIQVASVTGVYGVSFLVAWFSVCLAFAAYRLAREPNQRWAWLPDLALPLVVTLAVVGAGFNRLARLEPADRNLSLALVQPSIPQELIWDEREDANRFGQLMELSRLALAARPDLLVWPEAAMPSFSEANYQAITNLVAEHGVWMVFGADEAEAYRTANGEERFAFYNSAFLFGPDGRFRKSYRKQQLVIFGEYVPLEDQLPFLRMFTPIQGSFRSGPGPVAFELSNPPATLAPLICFEDVFAHAARRHVTEETDLLLNLTNNGWFGEGAAQWQHAASAVFRAVENGVPLVRCTNNGLTCWIDAVGRVRQVFGQGNGDVYGPGFMVVEVPLTGEGRGLAAPFYRQHGDWFGWGCVVVAVGGLLGRVLKKSWATRG